jgi:hypothetical protein
MSAPAEKVRGHVANIIDEQAFRRRRNHAQIEAMTGLILQAIGYPTRRHRDFICALQSTNSGNDSRVPYTPFRRAHLTLADLMMCEGAPDTRRKAVYREIVVLRRFQKRSGVMLFNVTSGSDEEATEYIDYLTPAADAAVQRMLSSPLWKTDKQAAKREAVAWAVEQLPRCDVEEEPGGDEGERPLADYQLLVEQRIRGAIEKAALEIERRGGDAEGWARGLMRELQRDLESRKKTAPARLDHSSLRAVEDVDEGDASGGDGTVLSGNTTGDDSVLPPSGEARDVDERKGADKNVAPPSGNSNASETYPFDEPSLFDQEPVEVAPKRLTPLEAALAYARRGWPVFPLHHPDPHRGCSCIDALECRSPGKHPRTRKGLKDATTDERQIRRWWELHPLANVGLATGKKSGLVAVDVDPRSGGDSSITELIERHGEMPDTLEAVTGGGGCHILFAHPGVSFKNSSSVLGEGLDVKTDGGYIVAAPSLHSSGKRYSWRTRRRPAAMPHWLLKLLTAETEKRATPAAAATRGRATSPAQSGPAIAEGSRNQRLFRIACSMRGNGSGHAEIEAELLDVNSSRCCPPLEHDEVRKIAASAAKYPVGR